VASYNSIRQFVVIKATDARAFYDDGDVEKITSLLASELAKLGYTDDFEITALPARKLEIADESGRLKPHPLQPVDTLDIGLALDSPENVDSLRKAVAKDTEHHFFVGVGADVSFEPTDCWCPGEAADPIYGDRDDAEELIDASVLQQHGLKGRHVNVVIVDRGLDPNHITIAGRWRFGTADPTPLPTPDNHAMMIARHIQKVAPQAAIFDCALLPEHISDIGNFIAVAHTAYVQMLADIAYWKQHHIRSTQWVFVNAWAIYDRRSEHPLGDYTEKRNHIFNQIVEQAARTEHIDIVFAAGNCGLFCPRMNCGRNDRGPGRSIFGANSDRHVLTTGAVRTDGMWLGYSSQGPGQPDFAPGPGRTCEKPDLCVPSQYRETDDAHLVNTGTSASCALAAAVIAALRSRHKWDSNTIPPDVLRRYLIDTARPTHYTGWDEKLGYGILNVKDAYNELHNDYP